MVLLTTPRVTVSFGLLNFRLRLSVCRSSDTTLAAGGVKYAFQARRLLMLCCTYDFIYKDHQFSLSQPVLSIFATDIKGTYLLSYQ